MDSNIVFGAVGSIQTSRARAANFFEGRRAEEWGTHESAAEVQQGLPNTKRGGRFRDSALVSKLPAEGGVSSLILGVHIASGLCLIVLEV